MIKPIDPSSHKEFAGHKYVFEYAVAGMPSGYVAIHSLVENKFTRCRVSDGGWRIYPYKHKEDALTDVLRLSKTMTYKAALAGLDVGGGKGVSIADPKKIENIGELLCKINRHVLNPINGFLLQNADGFFATGEDVGVEIGHVNYVVRETGSPWWFGKSKKLCGSGDPSPATAYGIFLAMQVCWRRISGKDSLKDCRVAIQGLGKVGFSLTRMLHEEGVRLVGADPIPECIERARGVTENKIEIVSPEAIYKQHVDIFAPCALGAILNEETTPELACAAVCGGANNQLATPLKDGHRLLKREILYAPDYVVNAGGLIRVYYERDPGGVDDERVFTHIGQIPQTLEKIYDRSKDEGVATSIIADQMAEEVIQKRKAAGLQ